MPLAASIFKQFQKKKLQASSLYLNDHCAERAQNSEKNFIVRAGLLYIHMWIKPHCEIKIQ